MPDTNVQSGESLGVTAIGLNPWRDQLRYPDVMLNLWANIDNHLDVKPNLLEQFCQTNVQNCKIELSELLSFEAKMRRAKTRIHRCIVRLKSTA